MTITYQKATEADVDCLLWLLKQTMDVHLANSGVALSEADQLLRVNYLFDQAKIVFLDGKIAGLLKLDENQDNIQIVQIQIQNCNAKASANALSNR